MKNKQRGFHLAIIPLIIIIIGIVGFTGWYVYNSNNKTNKALDSVSGSSSQVSDKSTPTPNSSPTPTPDPTTNWQKEVFGSLTFKRKPGWTYANPYASYTKKDQGAYIYTDISSKDLTIGLSRVEYVGLDFETYLEERSKEPGAVGPGYNKRELTINGVKALRYDNNVSDSQSDNIYFVLDNYLYKINVFGLNLTEEDISTFKLAFDSFLSTINF